jgi:hypothetical protein
VEDTGHHFDFARHPGADQAFGIGEILVMEQVMSADANPRRRKPAEVVSGFKARSSGRVRGLTSVRWVMRATRRKSG